MSVPEVSPEDAAAGLQQEAEEAVYLDVRTVEEFRRGHPRGALNVPLLERHPQTGQPVPNADFLAVVEAAVPREAVVYCGCASGERSRQAATLLRQAGWEEAVNVEAGFTGVRDPLGSLRVPGWKQRDLPTDDGDGGERSYRSLRAGAAL